jgi:putative Mg2+ transporter-C (MgtC) family protein
MPLILEWGDAGLRLALALLAGAVIGLDRGDRGRPAGVRTTMLVCLASAFAMLLANALLSTSGRAQNSFVTFDVMRLPLGILTGMGFIGGGAILRRDGLVLGVTTAATLWFVTVAGLCFGAGQLVLGLVGTVLALAVLQGMSFLEAALPQDREATLSLTIMPEGPTRDEIEAVLREKGYRVAAWRVAYLQDPPRCELRCDIRWRAPPGNVRPPDLVEELHGRPQVIDLDWQP